MVTFIHTADIHFGMENYGRVDAKTGIHSRLLDFQKALNSCIDSAIEKNVDFFLFAGDAYKTATPSPTQQKLLLKCFLRLYKHNIPVVIIVGNHDNPLSYGKAHSLDIFGALPVDGFHVIAKPTTLVLETKHGPVQIVGIPWPTRNTIALNKTHLHQTPAEITQYISQAVSTIIQTSAQKLDPDLPAVLSGHLTVSSGVFSGSEKRAIYGTDPVLLPSELAIKPFDYVALGHLHRYQNLNKEGHPAIVYSGSIERIDMGERKEDKGFCFVTIHDKNTTEHQFITVPTRPFIQIELHISKERNQTQQVVDNINKHNIEGAVVKLLYYLPTNVADKVDIKVVQRALENAWYIVGIIPIHSQPSRSYRAALQTTMSFSDLLTTYFSNKELDAQHTKNLIDKALALQQQVENEHED
jgi:DNA repair protein SbcD/Mre11